MNYTGKELDEIVQRHRQDERDELAALIVGSFVVGAGAATLLFLFLMMSKA